MDNCNAASTTSYVSPFVADGYTKVDTIPESPGRWSAIQIRYRPICADDESEIFARSRLEPATPLIVFYAEKLAEKILDWDIKDAGGKKLPVTAANIRRLTSQCYEQIKCVVDGSILLPSGATKSEDELKNS